MSDELSFGGWLKQRRRTRDLTQEQLGELVGCAAETIRRFEGDRLRPSRATALRLAEQLGLAGDERAAFVQAARKRSAAPVPDGAGEAPGGPSPVAGAGQRHPLPAATTPLLGRAQEVAFACALLRRPVPRLLTLTGAGGTGKTRVALEVASRAAADFRDGVVFVALDALVDPALVATTIGQALGVSEQAGAPIEQLLTRYLHDRQLLLVLDNFEQILPAAPLVASLLAAAAELKVLVTSRALLHLTGEQECALLPLPVPVLERLPPTEALTQYAAVELFVQRVQAVDPGFALTEANARDVAHICWRLDGIPLALILAAAWCKLFRPADLLARLTGGVALRSTGVRDLPPRQQTLRATVEWSYRLLGPGEQVLFRRLAVFAGGFTLEAAEAVCAGDGTQSLDVIVGLQALLETSLAQRVDSADGVPRLRMLETIRAYALEQLDADEAANAVHRRHGLYFLALAEAAMPALHGPEQVAWLERLEGEHDNIRAGLQWALSAGEAELALRLGAAVTRFWLVRGHLSEGRAWLERALLNTDVSDAVRADALHAAGTLVWEQGQPTAARLFETSLALSRSAGDRYGIARALGGLASVAQNKGDLEGAVRLYGESLALYDALDERDGAAYVLHHLGEIAWEYGDYDVARVKLEESLARFRELGNQGGIAATLKSLADMHLDRGSDKQALALLEESLALFRTLGDKDGIAYTLHSLGVVARRQGGAAQAQALLEESLARFRELGIQWGAAYALNELGTIEQERGEHRLARTRFRESLLLHQETGDRWGIAEGLLSAARLAAAQGRVEHAVRLIAAGETMYQAIGAVRSPIRRAQDDSVLEAVRAQLDDATFATAWAEGREMSSEQAVAATLDALADETGTFASAPGDPAQPASRLTAREVQVLRVVAEGATDQEVAARLGLRPRTVTSYLTSIYTKLEVRTRSAAVRVARERDVIA